MTLTDSLANSTRAAHDVKDKGVSLAKGPVGLLGWAPARFGRQEKVSSEVGSRRQRQDGSS